MYCSPEAKLIYKHYHAIRRFCKCMSLVDSRSLFSASHKIVANVRYFNVACFIVKTCKICDSCCRFPCINCKHDVILIYSFFYDEIMYFLYTPLVILYQLIHTTHVHWMKQKNAAWPFWNFEMLNTSSCCFI